MKKKKYLPLEMYDYVTAGENGLQHLIRKGVLPKDITLKEFGDFIFSPDFLNMDYQGRMAKLNHYVKWSIPAIMEMYKDKEIPTSTSLKTEIQDIVGMEPVIWEWAQYRKVYRLDEDFLSELVKTENIGIPKGLFNQLPFSNFYIDFGNIKESIDPFQGVFVRISPCRDGEQVVLYLITGDANIFSYYSDLYYGENDVANLMLSENDGPIMAYDFSNQNMAKSYPKDNRNNVIRAVFQVLLFLASSNTDQKLSQVPRTSAYPEKSRINFRDLEIWNVGVRYGQAIRFSKKDESKQPDSEQPVKISYGNGSKKRPHVRCAHWQRYHVGKNRTELRIRWLLPTFVGSKEIPVTIQKLK